MKGDRDRDPNWSTGQKSQGPNQEQKEGEHEQGTQDREGYTHILRQWGCSFGNSPRPAGLSLKKHGIKPDLLNIADNEDYRELKNKGKGFLILLHVLALGGPGRFGCSTY